ncbi:MAG: chemotaxis protein CheX [Syntrophomonadaceae bacterium]|nr:chemotaxis protein CheX [Syntrophomonadaceae bacterium]
MSTSHIAPFIKCSVNILKDMLGLEVKSGATENEGDAFTSRGFSVIVGFTGGWKGRFFLDMSGETAMQIASILTGEDYSSVADEEVLLSGAEIGNIISGNAITDINNSQPGLNLRLTPPSVFAGDSLSMFNVRLNSSSVLIDTSAGAIKINVAVEEGKK